jgi:ornithine cyclodeaminase/alanine dehydrogenase-like protein (mu-crystallin family)
MEQAIGACEEALRSYALGEAVEGPVTDAVVRGEGRFSGVEASGHELKDEPVYYSLRTLKGVLPSERVSAVRVMSEILAWPQIAGFRRRAQIARAPGGRFSELVLFFDTTTTELLAIVPDSFLQRLRMGAVTAIGSKYLAREDSLIYGLIGSGLQAGAQLEGMCAVRPIREVKVFSLHAEHRSRFARVWQERLQIPIRAVNSLEEAVRESDIVGLATNAFLPVLRDPDLLRKGAHLTCISPGEVAREVFDRCDRAVVFATVKPHPPEKQTWSTPATARHRLHYYVQEGLQDEIPEIQQYARSWVANPEFMANLPTLGEVISGRAPGRRNREEITFFWKNYGWGLEFAALGALVIRLAREKGIGTLLPSEWFTQKTHG